jgi:hypothetical protein
MVPVGALKDLSLRGAILDPLFGRPGSGKTFPLFRSVQLVVSGGSSLPGGFVQRFSAALSEIDTGVQISDIRAAADSLNATAKGALVAALAGI